MDFSKLGQNEKLATYGSVAVIVGAIVGGVVGGGFGWLAVLAAIAMLVVIFLPQFSPATNLPGSKGSLMLICGGVAAVILVLGLLASLGFLSLYFSLFALNAIFFLIAVAGGILMGWAGWQAFQAEGGKFQIGNASTSTATSAPPPAAPSETIPPNDERQP